MPTKYLWSPRAIFSWNLPHSAAVPAGTTSPSIHAINTSVLSKRSLSPLAISREPANFFLPSTPLMAVFSTGLYKLISGKALRNLCAHSVFRSKSPYVKIGPAR